MSTCFSCLWFLTFDMVKNLESCIKYRFYQSVDLGVESRNHHSKQVAHRREKEVATHSSVLAWRILWTEEPGGLLSMGLHRVGHDWSDLACMHALGKEMATHSSILTWRIPGTEEPGGLPSVGSQSRARLKQCSSSSSSQEILTYMDFKPHGLLLITFSCIWYSDWYAYLCD